VTALSATTGVVLWHAKGPSDRLLLSGDVLLAAQATPAGRGVTARTVLTGADVYHGRLPDGVVAGLHLGEDRVFLSDQDVGRLSPAEKARWRTPLTFPKGEGRVAGGLVELPRGDLIAFRYRPTADSEVHLVRIKAGTGEVVWRARCDSLGGGPSKYFHYATVAVDGDGLRVTSRGTSGGFVEVLDLRTGKPRHRTRLKD
jgi:hypothetical protein